LVINAIDFILLHSQIIPFDSHLSIVVVVVAVVVVVVKEKCRRKKVFCCND